MKRFIRNFILVIFFVAIFGCGGGETGTGSVNQSNENIKAEFCLIRKVDILRINEYSAKFEVKDKDASKIVFEESENITPCAVELYNGKGEAASIVVDEYLKKIGIKAVDGNGNQLGKRIEVVLE